MMFARVENSVTTFSPKKENAKILDQKQQFNEFSIWDMRMGNFHFFGREKTNFGGGVTSKLASQ